MARCRENSLDARTGPGSATIERPVVVTGDRPTGRLHLGHLVGSLSTRLAMQDRYECFFLVADLHPLTMQTDRLRKSGRTSLVSQSTG
jgi:tryptophanyl-tRNA synthetase